MKPAREPYKESIYDSEQDYVVSIFTMGGDGWRLVDRVNFEDISEAKKFMVDLLKKITGPWEYKVELSRVEKTIFSQHIKKTSR